MGTIYNKPAVLPAWGETNTTAADMIQPADQLIQQGWPLSAIPPSRQFFNWVLNYGINAVRYFMQRGLVDYDAAETYGLNARVIGDDGNTWTSLVADNIGNVPSASPDQWAAWGLTVPQINASQLTQANVAAGDSSTKVANTSFVTAAIAAVAAGLGNRLLPANAAIGAMLISDGAAFQIRQLTIQNQTANRGFNQPYQNNTGAEMSVNVTGNQGSGGGAMTCYVAMAEGNLGASPCGTSSRVPAADSNPVERCMVSFRVPTGAWYQVSEFNLNYEQWTEWVYE